MDGLEMQAEELGSRLRVKFKSQLKADDVQRSKSCFPLSQDATFTHLKTYVDEIQV